MARNAAAMPQLVCRNCLRLKPRCVPFTSASSLIRASTFFCTALCGGGRYSPLETIWVGIGVAADAASAPATRRCSRSLSQVLIVFLPFFCVDNTGRRAHEAREFGSLPVSWMDHEACLPLGYGWSHRTCFTPTRFFSSCIPRERRLTEKT